MTAKEIIKTSLDMHDMILATYLSDLSDTDLMVRPFPGMNHAAWQLGHLIGFEREMLTKAGFNMPALPDGFAESYTPETASSDDPGEFHKKDEYLNLLKQQREGTVAAMECTSETDLDKPTPESMHAYAKTIGALFNHMGTHVMMHAAQLVALRRKLDKPVLI